MAALPASGDPAPPVCVRLPLAGRASQFEYSTVSGSSPPGGQSAPLAEGRASRSSRRDHPTERFTSALAIRAGWLLMRSWGSRDTGLTWRCFRSWRSIFPVLGRCSPPHARTFKRDRLFVSSNRCSRGYGFGRAGIFSCGIQELRTGRTFLLKTGYSQLEGILVASRAPWFDFFPGWPFVNRLRRINPTLVMLHFVRRNAALVRGVSLGARWVNP